MSPGPARVRVLAIAWTRGEGTWLYRAGFPLCALAALAVLAAASHPVRGPIAWTLERRPLVALGVISSGITELTEGALRNELAPTDAIKTRRELVGSSPQRPKHSRK